MQDAHKYRYWVKTVNAGDQRLATDWGYLDQNRDWFMDRIHFSKRPTLGTGDRMLYYATGHGCVFGAVAVPDGSVVHDESASRWAFSMRVRPLLLVPIASMNPRLADLGISNLSIRSQSHIEIARDTYLNGVQMLTRLASTT